MNLLPKQDLFERIKHAIEDSGGSYKIITHRPLLPYFIYVFKGEESNTLRIYIWNITHGGGRKRPHNEFRIQITGISKIDDSNPPKTLLLGWDTRYKVFAGFNASRYKSFGQSPSIQVKEETLSKASKDGIAIQPKEWDESGKNVTEVAIAFSPELFLIYAFNLDVYHHERIDINEFRIIKEVVSRPSAEPQNLSIIPEPRRREIRQFKIAVRNAKFRKNILQVYMGIVVLYADCN